MRKTISILPYVASIIQENTGADIFRIQPQEAYPTKHSTLVSQAEKEQEENARPEIKNKLKNLDDYDTIFVGFPIWWSDLPQIMYTFFDIYDFGGKTIIPFVTHGGSGFSDTINTIKKLEPEATVISEGLSISRNDVAKAQEDVKEWAEALLSN